MTTLLVTGGAGFIGSKVVDAALERGWRVRLLDSFRADVHGEAPAALAEHPDLEVVAGDVGDAAVIGPLLRGVDVVCHQAAKVGLGVGMSDAPDYVASNDLATAVLLSAMAEQGVGRLVLASSMVVYGEGRYRDETGDVEVPPRRTVDLEACRFEPISPRTGHPLTALLITETARLDPRNVYAASKVAQEHLAASWARSCGGRAAMLRYHNVYGPGMPTGTPYAGVAAIFRTALAEGRAPRVFEDGGQRRDFVHVRDVAAANLAAVGWTSTSEPGAVRPFNVGSGEVRTIGEMARALSAAVGGPEPVVTGEYRLGDVRHITASSDRLRTETDWTPQVTFAAGMSELATAPMRPAATGQAR
ncbi:NAD-dependent epimerase/dehydratase family protein [Ruania halotolerans]|uniref:NAD-dependent epimerase/dehydratase family protein n=1 Tax=Ruania halotolerans TaxID=2897773 RepID=UPI001E434FDF|nr:NAD-dependent epimerase/dehydratase family protein [Ruania halotolerans]UFU06318.1 NAD-dependent epimerase/dehydratase family protein [Ruania halotolerans]